MQKVSHVDICICQEDGVVQSKIAMIDRFMLDAQACEALPWKEEPHGKEGSGSH